MPTIPIRSLSLSLGVHLFFLGVLFCTAIPVTKQMARPSPTSTLWLELKDTESSLAAHPRARLILPAVAKAKARGAALPAKASGHPYVAKGAEAPPVPEVVSEGGGLDLAKGTDRSAGSNGAAFSFAEELRLALDKCKEYPPLAKARKQSGRVGVRFTVMKSGRIVDAQVVSPCSFVKLNEAALQTVTKLGSFKPVPDEVSKTDWKVVVPIEFRLN